MAYLLASFLGVLVAAVELASRYRDKPVALLGMVGSWIYVGLNAATSAAALAAARAFGWDFGATSSRMALVVQVLAAGVAGLALLRSSVFVVRIGDRDVGVGASVIVSELLGIIDKSIDRRRAADRALLVTEIMKNVSFEKAYLPLPGFCLSLL